MSITIRRNGFQATVCHHGRRWRRQFETRDDAVRWEAESRLALMNNRIPEIPQMDSELDAPKTLREMIDYTFKRHWIDCKSGRGLKQNADMVAAILGESTPIVSICPLTIDGVIDALRESGNSNGTINRKMAALSKVLMTAADIGVIQAKPKIRMLKEKNHRLRWYSNEELAEFSRCADRLNAEVFGDFIRFLADTGLRLSEALSLTWDDLVGDLIIVPDSKSGSPRSVPMTPAVQGILHARCTTGTGPFSSMSKDTVRTLWNRIRNMCGLEGDPQAVIHTLRHTFISRLVQAGVPILTVKELAGHKSIEMTLRYAHLAPHNLTEAIRTIS